MTIDLIVCPYCGGNDQDTPCAYPSEGKPGCLRDIRLAETVPQGTLAYIVCVPIRLSPSFPETAKYSVYEAVECPDCHEKMWLGARSKVVVELNHPRVRLLCLTCAAIKGLPIRDMQKLTDADQ